jgi:hypothetical protein
MTRAGAGTSEGSKMMMVVVTEIVRVGDDELTRVIDREID